MVSPEATPGNSSPTVQLWPVVVVVTLLVTVSAAVIYAEDQLNKKAEALKNIRRVIEASGTVLSRADVAAIHSKFDVNNDGHIHGDELKDLANWVRVHVGEEHVR